jgi:hypothetical protein
MRPPIPLFPGRRGSVIVVVLALITLAAFFLSQFIERSMTEMLVESRARQGERLRVDAHSALEATLAVLADYQAVDNGLRSPAQGWGDPLAGLDFVTRPGTTVAVQVEDESGRISLPRLSAEGLAHLGRQLGLKDSESEKMADALLAWTRREHTSGRFETDPRNYEYEDPPHRVPGRPLASFDELAAIAVARDLFYTPEGQPTPLRDEFVRSVSLYDFPSINLNSAQLPSLELAGWDPDQAEKIVAFNAGETARVAGTPPYFRSVAEAQAFLGVVGPATGFDTQVRCLRIRVTVGEGATSFHLTAVVVPGTATANPPTESAGQGSTATASLQYPFTVLAFEESIALASAPVL